MPASTDMQNLAYEAERNLNSSKAKTGNNKSSDEAGVDTTTENSFPGSQVKYGDDLVTNAGYNRRIPPDEGGDLDGRGRQTRGSQFEGEGGPEDKFDSRARNAGGDNDADVEGAAVPQGYQERQGGDALAIGEDAVRSNLANKVGQTGGRQYKGEDYYKPEDVPDSIAAQNNIPPESVIQASKETEGF